MKDKHTRAPVTVNGKEAAATLPYAGLLVVPAGFSVRKIVAALNRAGYETGSEWRDGTGTTTVIIHDPEETA